MLYDRSRVRGQKGKTYVVHTLNQYFMVLSLMKCAYPECVFLLECKEVCNKRVTTHFEKYCQ